jgi:hypothetical protein
MVDVPPALGTDYHGVEKLPTDEEREIHDGVSAFCEKEVVPLIGQYWEWAEVLSGMIPKPAEIADTRFVRLRLSRLLAEQDERCQGPDRCAPGPTIPSVGTASCSATMLPVTTLT